MEMRCAIPIVSALAYLIPAVTLVGCGEATAGLEDVSELVGVYDLKTVDGGPPPAREGFDLAEIDGEPVQVFTTEVFRAILTLEIDRSFSEEVLFRTEIFTLGGQKIFDETVPLPGPGGTWSYSRPSVTFRYASGTVETGTVGSGTVTVIRDGSAWVYERRG
jgi:hypothetical protein